MARDTVAAVRNDLTEVQNQITEVQKTIGSSCATQEDLMKVAEQQASLLKQVKRIFAMLNEKQSDSPKQETQQSTPANKTGVLCGNCKEHHQSAEDVKVCWEQRYAAS